MRIAFYGNFTVPYTSESHHAATLEAMGHQVHRIQEPGSLDGLRYQAFDLFIWVHTHGYETPNIEKHLWNFHLAGVPRITYHLDLYLPLPRWDRYVGHPYLTMMDHWFTVDPAMATWITHNTEATGHWLQAGVFDQECVAVNVVPPHRLANDVVFVGSRGYHPEWPYRPQLVDWLGNTYGSRFTHIGRDGVGTVRGLELNQIYQSSKVVVGDSLCPNFDYYGYWSDRVYETLGRGGFLIHPLVKGMGQHFTGNRDLVWYRYGDFDSLKELIDYYVKDDEARDRIRKQGHETVVTKHTYRHRWQTILDTIA